jgi:hypothetical protein
MAQSQQPERGGEAEFVRRIVTDPKNVPDVMRLYGYPGASSEENHDRLYLNPDLSQYVEVPRHAILHRMAVPTEQDPNGAVVVWVRRDAALIYKSAPAAQALAQYFAGAIAGATAAGAAAAPRVALTHPVLCWPTRIGPACPDTVQLPCTPACPYPSEICTPACTPRYQTATGPEFCTIFRPDCAAAAPAVGPVLVGISYPGLCIAHSVYCPLPLSVPPACQQTIACLTPACLTHFQPICATPICTPTPAAPEQRLVQQISVQPGCNISRVGYCISLIGNCGVSHPVHCNISVPCITLACLTPDQTPYCY